MSLMKNPFHVMIIPTLGCPGQCKYCWSSDVHSPKMTLETADAIVRWLEPLEDQRVTFTFHGGEPLLAGPEFYRYILPKISSRLAHLSPEFAMQTNSCRVSCAARLLHRWAGDTDQLSAW